MLFVMNERKLLLGTGFAGNAARMQQRLHAHCPMCFELRLRRQGLCFKLSFD